MDELRAEDWLSRRNRRAAPDTRHVPITKVDEDGLEGWALGWTRPHDDHVLNVLTLARGLAQLPPREAVVLRALYLEGVSVEVVGKRLKVSGPRITQLRIRALARLRDLFADLTDSADSADSANLADTGS